MTTPPPLDITEDRDPVEIEREEILALFNAWAPTYLKGKDTKSWRDRAIAPFDAFCAGYKLGKER